MSLIHILGVEGLHCNVTPTTKGLNHTEIYSKHGNGIQEYMGCIIFDITKNKYVLYELHPDYQMTLDCIKEAFELTEKYWKSNPRA